MEACAQCAGQGRDGTIRLCSSCKAIGYCSRDCQKRHWSVHKTDCKAMAKDKRVPDKALGQQTDGRETESTGTTSPARGGATGEVPLMTCHKCGMQRNKMHKCGSCLEVTYCSRDCQRADWKVHKATCRTVEKGTTEDRRQTSPKGEKYEATRSPQTETLSSSSNKTQVDSPPAISWEEARARAERLYPGHRIVDKFWKLETDFMGFVRAERVVALVRIASPYPHCLWHGRLLEDAEGSSSFVLLHTPNDPRPHFRYEQLCEGNFFCYQHAFMHFFRDGTVGFRVDEARYVHILEPITEASKFSPCALPVNPTTPTPTSSASVTATPELWRTARSEAQRMFPETRVLDSLQDIDRKSLSRHLSSLCTDVPDWAYEDFDYSKSFVDEGEIKETLLVQLWSPLFHSWNHSWVVKDSKGKPAQLKMLVFGWFAPLFPFTELRRGLFVCVCKPNVSVLRDCYVFGAKRDPSSVKIIRL